MTNPENERLATLEQKTDDIKSDVAEIKTSLKDLAENMDKRYAAKWAEKVVGGLVAACLLLVFAVFIQSQFHHSTVQTVTVTTRNPDGSSVTKTIPLTDAGVTSGTTTSPSGTTSDTPGTTVTQTNTPPNSQTTGNGSLLDSITSLFK